MSLPKAQWQRRQRQAHDTLHMQKVRIPSHCGEAQGQKACIQIYATTYLLLDLGQIDCTVEPQISLGDA